MSMRHYVSTYFTVFVDAFSSFMFVDEVESRNRRLSRSTPEKVVTPVKRKRDKEPEEEIIVEDTSIDSSSSSSSSSEDEDLVSSRTDNVSHINNNTSQLLLKVKIYMYTLT